MRVAVLGRVQDPYRRSLNHWLGGQPGLTLWPCVGRDGLMPQIVAASPQITGAVDITLTAETVFLFGSDCLPAARAAAQNRCQPLEYGFSRRDTLTLSSLDDRQAVVALQRPLRRQLAGAAGMGAAADGTRPPRAAAEPGSHSADGGAAAAAAWRKVPVIRAKRGRRIENANAKP